MDQKIKSIISRSELETLLAFIYVEVTVAWERVTEELQAPDGGDSATDFCSFYLTQFKHK